MISSFAFLNKTYFYSMISGLLILAVSAAAFIALPENFLPFPLLALALALILAGLIAKILVWYNVYSEVVTKEEFKKVTAHGSVFQKKK